MFVEDEETMRLVNNEVRQSGMPSWQHQCHQSGVDCVQHVEKVSAMAEQQAERVLFLALQFRCHQGQARENQPTCVSSKPDSVAKVPRQR